ncbi:MAG TPA: aminopeptidase [Bacilli bacterium]|jgi:aminopeptidase|nr:aminopeptidase [Bacilli bacterium]HQA55667.1 aminopeptidase [Bacilli bacterium]
MKEKLLHDYAKLIVRKGINVQKGEIVWVYPQLDQPDFVTMVVEECYKAGAKNVVVYWSHDQISRLAYKYETVSSLADVNSIAIARLKYRLKKMPTMLYLISDDPDAFKGVNQAKISKARAKSYPKIKKYLDQLDSKYKWCIAAVPGLKWAEKVFPDVKGVDAIEKLWEKILFTSRVDGNDPVENWNKHNEFLISQRNKLESLKLRKLHYKSANGTNFSVELIPGVRWGGGVETAPNKGEFNPNIPSEEVFTTPLAGRCEGTLFASKPLSYNGEIIDGFSITFKNGKVVKVHAEKNQGLLEKMVAMDEGAAKLGEVALVPYDSPIRQSNTLFYNTLFDENAACHFALGRGFRELLPDSENMSAGEVEAKGINSSMIHVDFMVGTKDLSIVGEDEKGHKTQIFKDGNWSI